MNPLAQELALALAIDNQGNTSPNPSVGAVIVKDGEIIGKGATQPAGGKHAEVIALESCTLDPYGADLYVTLEPCCHYGKTGPCTDLIIQAGIKKVFIGYTDPNPVVSGRGREQLLEHGLEVMIWPDQQACSEIYTGFTKYITAKQPYVTAKFAMSLDGKICTRTGDSKWISNHQSRRIVHNIRRKSDAILTGIGTVLADNPSLTARGPDDLPWTDRQPTRIITDSQLRSGRQPDLNIFNQPGKTMIASTIVTQHHLLPESVAIHVVTPNEFGRVDLEVLMSDLANLGFINIMVEGGNNLLGNLFDCGLVDKVVVFVAPIIIGGTESKSPIGGLGHELISQALNLKNVQMNDLEGDICITGYV